jgi:hypothetical protein
MCQDLARAAGFRLVVWNEVVLHVREHQQKEIQILQV